VAVELTEHLAGWERVRQTLGEIRTTHDQYDTFFSDVFDRLGSFSKNLLLQRERMARSTGEVRQDNEQTYAVEEAVRGQVDRLAEIAVKLSESRPEHSQDGDPWHDDRSKLEQKIEDARREQADLQQQRAILEAELESVRNRAAETVQSLAEQKRLAVGQEKRWTGELKQLRHLLETLTDRLAECETRGSTPPPKSGRQGSGDRAATAKDPALQAVMDQFEKLHNDLSKRRAKSPSPVRGDGHE